MSIIVVNGAGSAGKSTLCRELQRAMPIPFLHFSADLILFGGVLPPLAKEGPFSWPEMRPRVFEGYYGCLTGLASAGNDVLTDIVLEDQAQFERLSEAIAPFDPFSVGVHCPLATLIERETARGDRRIGDAERDFATVHTFRHYDVEVDSTCEPVTNAHVIIEVFLSRVR